MANKRQRDYDAGTPVLTDVVPIDRPGLTEIETATLAQLQTLLVDDTQILAVMAALSATLDLNGQTITNVANVDGRDIAADGTKLDGIEALADVTDGTNVAAAGAPIVTSGAGSPTSTPAAVGDVYVDTTADTAWIAAGTASSADWKQATGAGGGDLLAANNLSDVANAGTSRTNLGVAIGTDVQAHDAVLDATTASFLVADETKLNGIEALADVTDETNVVAALDGATLSDVGTPAATDKVLLQDASDTDNLKYADFSEFGGGGGGGGNLSVPSGVPVGAFLSTIWGEYATIGGTQDRVYFAPLYVAGALTVSAMGCSLNTAGGAGSVLRFGLWNDDGAGRPGTLLLDAGTVSSTTAGFKSVTGLSQALSANTTYWVGVCAQVASAPTYRGIGSTQAIAQSTATANTDSAGFTESSITGAFPATAPSLDTAPSTVVPRVVVQR